MLGNKRTSDLPPEVRLDIARCQAQDVFYTSALSSLTGGVSFIGLYLTFSQTNDWVSAVALAGLVSIIITLVMFLLFKVLVSDVFPTAPLGVMLLIVALYGGFYHQIVYWVSSYTNTYALAGIDSMIRDRKATYDQASNQGSDYDLMVGKAKAFYEVSIPDWTRQLDAMSTRIDKGKEGTTKTGKGRLWNRVADPSYMLKLQASKMSLMVRRYEIHSRAQLLEPPPPVQEKELGYYRYTRQFVEVEDGMDGGIRERRADLLSTLSMQVNQNSGDRRADRSAFVGTLEQINASDVNFVANSAVIDSVIERLEALDVGDKADTTKYDKDVGAEQKTFEPVILELLRRCKTALLAEARSLRKLFPEKRPALLALMDPMAVVGKYAHRVYVAFGMAPDLAFVFFLLRYILIRVRVRIQRTQGLIHLDDHDEAELVKQIDKIRGEAITIWSWCFRFIARRGKPEPKASTEDIAESLNRQSMSPDAPTQRDSPPPPARATGPIQPTGPASGPVSAPPPARQSTPAPAPSMARPAPAAAARSNRNVAMNQTMGLATLPKGRARGAMIEEPDDFGGPSLNIDLSQVPQSREDAKKMKEILEAREKAAQQKGGK